MIDEIKLEHIDHVVNIRDKYKGIENKENLNWSWDEFSLLMWTRIVKASVKVTMYASIKYC